MTISITPAGRDLTFSFKDSCNSRCCRPTKDSSPIYINKYYQIEPFHRITKRVTQPHKQHQQSFRRIQAAIIQSIKQLADLNIQATMSVIERISQISFYNEIESKQTLTLHKINRINEALEEFYDYYKTSSESSTPTKEKT